MGTAGSQHPDIRPTRILIVDDHPIVRQGLARLIGRDPGLRVCGEAGNAAEALKLLHAERPDLVILDLSLATGSGLELAKDIQARWPGLPMLMLSMYDEAFCAERALRAGAKGYIMKDQAADEVLTAIRKVLRGEIYLSDKMTGRMVQQAVSGVREPMTSPVERLSNRELEIFQLISQGMSTREIAEALHLSVKTIETHKAHIKEKLGIARAPDLLFHAIHWAQETSAGEHPPSG